MSETEPPDGGRPVIKAMTWLAAREVLGGEASDFTPWLAENLELLGDALGLAELILVETESAVAEKRLDILATGTEHDGSEYPVVIENQYGITDHKHLGQLVTYLAQQGRGLAVWIVEANSEAHAAAVDFLNRTSTSEVGYVLARVRFTSSGAGEYQVDFEILSRPNSFLRKTGRRIGGGAGEQSVNQPKKTYLQEILQRSQVELATAGLRNIRMHTRGAYIEMRFPAKAELDDWSTKLKIKVTRQRCSVGLHIAGFDSREENEAALQLVRDRYESAIAPLLPSGTQLEWNAAAQHSESDFVGAALPQHGYEGGDPVVASNWAIAVCAAWAKVVSADPINGIESKVQEIVAQTETPTRLDID